jgi:hypothetical protein
MGFPGHFLVVADFMWAKKNGIAVGPGRDSAEARPRHRRTPRPRSRPAAKT